MFRFNFVPPEGNIFRLFLRLKLSILGLSLEKGNSNGVKKELFWVRSRWVGMRESEDCFGEHDEDTETQNLPLYTERMDDGIYRYRRRVSKTLVEKDIGAYKLQQQPVQSITRQNANASGIAYSL